MNNIVLAELKTQLTEIIGMISLVEVYNIEDEHFIKQANARLIGLVHGLDIIIDHPPEEEKPQ